jgi:uncharacterized protein (DUF3820 family)
MRMPFGKHAGVELADVPNQYLRWIRSQPWLRGTLTKEIDEVLHGETVISSEESFEESLKKWKEGRDE